MPPLTAAQRGALKGSIREYGVLVPVEEDEYGDIIDGHERVAIWHELRAEGVKVSDYPRTLRPGLTDAEKRALARTLNLQRRHLTRAQRRRVIADQLREDAAQSDNRIAEVLGVSHNTVRSVRDELEATGQIDKLERTVGADGRSRPARRPSIFAKNGREASRACRALEGLDVKDLPGQLLDARRLERLVTRKRWQVNKDRVPDPDFSWSGVDLRLGDCEQALSDVPDGSVDLIISDPPYDHEGVFDIRSYDKLGRLAARLLRDDGLLLAYLSNMFCVPALNDLVAHLDYLWTLALVYKGRQSSVRDRAVHSSWKPIVAWVQKGSGRTLGWVRDVVAKDAGPEKNFHPWQQGVDECRWMIEQFTKPGDLVCDPFFGSATTAVAAVRSGRRFVGCDVAPGYLATAQQRLAELKPGRAEEDHHAD
jgi:hypothetical protein